MAAYKVIVSFCKRRPAEQDGVYYNSLVEREQNEVCYKRAGNESL